ncbi:MAG TPA: diguanylate cyclase [Phycisphaerae bacterium]|nr:diguanylate cyclase [Phycisphaerae bacterium]
MFPSEAYGVVVRILLLCAAVVAVPWWGWRWAGGKRDGYLAMTSGLVILLGAEGLALVGLVSPASVRPDIAAAIDLPCRAGGYLLILVGFLSVTYDFRRAKAGATAALSSERSRAEEARHERDFVRAVVETSEIVIISVALPDGAITLFNRGAERVTGYARDEVLGRRYREVLLPPDDVPLAKKVGRAILDGRFDPVGSHEHLIVTKSGERRLVSWTFTVSRDPKGAGRCDVVAYGLDVTEQRRMQSSLEQAKADLERANAELKRLAATDSLTELVNRRQANILLEREIARSRRAESPVGIVMIDLDRFKIINDTHGHDVGDAVLVHVARTLRSRLRSTDIVARYGGDEFLLVLPDTGLEDAARVADVLRDRMESVPVSCGAAQVFLRASFGVTVLRPGENSTITDLVRMADEAMYSAKGLGGGRVVTWGPAGGEVEPDLVSSDQVRGLQARVKSLNEQNRDAYLERLDEMVRDLESRHPHFVGHSERVARYAVAVARHMGLRPDQVEALGRAAVLHDIGRYVIQRSVLGKAGPLSRAEWALVRQHPGVGEKVVGQLRFLQREACIIRHHHERLDGHGYPDGLVGEAIPLEARILAVADALDAMTSARAHRGPLALGEALERLRTGAGTQFDEAAVGAAIAAAEEARDWPLQDSLSDPVEEVCASASGAGPWRRIPPPSRT